MTIELITLVLVAINCMITIFSFVGYACSKKRKEKLKMLETERLAKIEMLKKEKEQCEAVLLDDTTPKSITSIVSSLKSNIDSELEILNRKK